ncbi:MAG: hypothetical protein GC159_04140 [Phycisphaera sp.]|nr:hypothetical protein [Phycisphaera sp.]
MTRRISTMTIAAAAMAMWSTTLGGCASEGYVLRGKVVEGPVSSISVVAADDPRLAGPAVAGASVDLTLDPLSLGRRPLGNTTSYTDGMFQIPVDEFGAGTLEYHVGILARAQGHDTAEDVFMLPSSSRRILIVLKRGADRYRPKDDTLKELAPYLPKPLE